MLQGPYPTNLPIQRQLRVHLIFQQNNHLKHQIEEKNKYNTQLNFNTELALHKFKAHYEHVNSINFKEAILDFKYNNFVKMPPNDNDVCFVKIPDNVQIDYSTIGEINFTFKGYTLDAYNCNEK